VKKEKGKASEQALLEKLKVQLDNGCRCGGCRAWTRPTWSRWSGFRFLTLKPLLLVLNVFEAEVAKPAPRIWRPIARVWPGSGGAAGAVEMDIAQMSPEEQKNS